MFDFLTTGRARALLLGGTIVFAGLAMVLGDAKGQGGSSQPVVVELFTSQGCSSCPPADAFLGDLAQRDDVIALSMHVDYWDYIGWADPFAIAETTARQKGYRDTLDRRYVYTPQMVIDGKREAVGSRRDEVQDLIAESAAETKPLDISFDASRGMVVVPAGTAPAEGATVWLAVYDAGHETEIQRGENRGRTIRYSNVVRELREIGRWTGARLELSVDVAGAAAQGRDGCAVIVQQGATGAVLGAVKMDLNNS